MILSVSPSELFIERLLSSEANTRMLSRFQAAHVIFFVCFPIMGIRLKIKILYFIKSQLYFLYI